MGEKDYWTIGDVASLIGKTPQWVYRKSKQFDPAKITLAGEVIKPFRFDPIKIRELLQVGVSGSLKTKQNQKKPKSLFLLKEERKNRLWR